MIFGTSGKDHMDEMAVDIISRDKWNDDHHNNSLRSHVEGSTYPRRKLSMKGRHMKGIPIILNVYIGFEQGIMMCGTYRV